ncbi:MAG TPA: aminotransferase class I/II-fold pyridoxal phosphate-dependent enzyme [Naasia sp.]
MPLGNPVVDHREAPYSTALRALASHDWVRMHVPAHQGAAGSAPGIADLFGTALLSMDFPMSVVNIDQQTWRGASSGQPSPLVRAQALAADAWGARRTWFLTNGASGGNHIVTMVARALGSTAVVQRSVHSSVIDGICHAGLTARFVQPALHAGLSAALGVTADQVAAALRETPDAAAVLLVSPSYFGTVADVASIADVAHASGVPLIVDEAWGAHLGFSAQLPANAVRAGADLVVSSTHKGAGSLTQSAMLHLGSGPHAERIEQLVDRVVRSYQSTSCSAILLASLDEGRRNLATSPDAIGRAIEQADVLRAGLAASTRFRDGSAELTASPDVAAVDPLKVVVDVRNAGITGHEAQHVLIAEHRIYAELATPNALLLMVGATARTDGARILAALESLPVLRTEPAEPLPLPSPGPRALGIADAFFGATEVVPSADAEGRISADSLAAYPPGIPNVLPGEAFTRDVLAYLLATSAAPSGFVRGAIDSRLDSVRVVVDR